MRKTYVTDIDGKWYAYEGDEERYQVYSIGSDNPRGGGEWFAAWTNNGIQYVSSPSPTKAAAVKRARRNGTYGGCIYSNGTWV